MIHSQYSPFVSSNELSIIPKYTPPDTILSLLSKTICKFSPHTKQLRSIILVIIYVPKDSPQPQVAAALGFKNLKPPISPSIKSIVIPSKSGLKSIAL